MKQLIYCQDCGTEFPDPELYPEKVNHTCVPTETIGSATMLMDRCMRCDAMFEFNTKHVCDPLIAEYHQQRKVLSPTKTDNISRQTAKEVVGRVFESGAYRDQDESKLDFVKALSPEVLERYVSYLSATRLQSNGLMRDWDNWKAGIPKDVYLSSLYRHVHTVWKNFNKNKNLEEELCAIMFNSMGLLFEILKEKVAMDEYVDYCNKDTLVTTCDRKEDKDGND